ncbi:hypothetical protein CcrMagneto_gp238 [Caulobacter virus Magneto]|uniref:hypothetical protein n=1 Tax=Caulobacter virus Magneto TaxID=1211642 RepID=UPI00028A7763|nr:hypothetical protein CcrMagneto_gp238 [Caulobacter virus Magneto]AFU87408.1 hypothetical protein CcrMagneto_gp238 [Caulobacter virus Magneto]
MLTKDEITFAGLIKAMEDARRTAKAAGDLVSTAEIDRWFKEHAPIIREVRDKAEADEFDAGARVLTTSEEGAKDTLDDSERSLP